MNAVTLGVFWIVYYALHSLMASEGVKRVLKERIPAIYPYYRLLYSFFALVNFILLFVLHDMAPDDLIFKPNEWVGYSGVFLMLGSAIIVVFAGRTYGLGFLMREEEGQLITSGLNAYVRHPLYSGILLGLIGFFLAFPFLKNLVFSLISAIYLVVGSILEERKLIRIYGDEYRSYKRKVKMLIPGLF